MTKRATPPDGDEVAGLDRPELRAWQWSRLAPYLDRVSSTNPFYAERWLSAGVDVEKLDSLEAFAATVPIVRKEDFLADQELDPPFGRRLGVERSMLNGLHLTSGTSGIGQEIYGLTSADQRTSGETFAYCWRTAGAEQGDVIVLTVPVTFLAAGHGAVASTFVDQFAPIFGFGLDKKLVLELAARFGATVMYAPPTLLLQFEQTARAMGLEPKRDLHTLRGLVTSLFVPPFSLVQDAMDFWGVPVYDGYGSTQAGGVAACSCEYGAWDGTRRYPTHFNERYFVCEVVDPDTGAHVSDGEEGELVITPMWREASPVIRFGTRDRVVYTEGRDCPCGRAYAGIVPGETGRYDDMVKVKGMNIWPASIDNIVFAHKAVDEYRAKVIITDKAREELIISVAFKDDSDLSEQQRSDLLEAIEQQVKDTTLVRPRVMESLDKLSHFDFKPQRWTDERAAGLQKVTW